MKAVKLLVVILLVTSNQIFASEQQGEQAHPWWNILLMSRHRYDGQYEETRVSDCWNDQETCSKCGLGCCACCALCCMFAGAQIHDYVEAHGVCQYQPSDQKREYLKKKNI